MPEDCWSRPPDGFQYVLFDRTNPADNVHRSYLVGWLLTLFEDGAVVLVWGRKGSSQRVRAVPFGALGEAWPVMRAAIRARLRQAYKVVSREADHG